MKPALFILFFTGLSFIAKAQQTTSEAAAYDTIFTKPETFATYPGGEDGWKTYLRKNLKYPKKAWWEEIETDVVVKVIIDKDGNIKEAVHLTTAGYGFEQEAVRLVRNSGKWKPAINRGQPVACEGSLKIEFRLK